MLISATSSDPLWLLSDQGTSKCLTTMPFTMSTRRQWLSESKDANDLHLLVDNEFADVYLGNFCLHQNDTSTPLDTYDHTDES